MDDRTSRLPTSDEYDERDELENAIGPGEPARNPVLEYAGDEPRGPVLPARRTPNWWPLLVLLVMLILGIIVVALIATGSDDTGTHLPAPTPAPTPHSGTGMDEDRPQDLHAQSLPYRVGAPWLAPPLDAPEDAL